MSNNGCMPGQAYTRNQLAAAPPTKHSVPPV